MSKITGYPLSDLSMYQYMYQCNKYRLKNIAIEYFGTSITYQALLGNIENFRNAFERYNVQKGDFVTI